MKDFPNRLDVGVMERGSKDDSDVFRGRTGLPLSEIGGLWDEGL